MVQHIGVHVEDERGAVLARYSEMGAPVELIDLAPSTSVCLRFLDPYGDAVFNQLQLPVLIGELGSIRDNTRDEDLRGRLDSLIGFIDASRDIHTYVRFVGD